MLGGLFKKKISEETLSNNLLNGLIDTIENGFPEIAELINQDPHFTKRPSINNKDYDRFLFIVFVGNLSIMKEKLDTDESASIRKQLIEKFSKSFDLPVAKTNEYVEEYASFISRVNYPSKNILYGMSKAVFYKYNLSQFQDDYFKDLNTPNPLFLKQLNNLMKNFVWDWNYFLEKYKVD